MVRGGVVWRLEEGFSRFVKGSRVELRLQEGPLRQTLDVYPAALPDRSKPIAWHLRAVRSFSGRELGDLRWRLRPESSVQMRILFAGGAFLGNFRVPAEHFAVQWDLALDAESSAGKAASVLLFGIDGKTRFTESWVTLFPENVRILDAIYRAWRSYASPLDAREVLTMPQGQVIRRRWRGRVQIQMGMEWDLGLGWALPGATSLARIRKQLAAGASAGARFRVAEEGEFTLQLRKRDARIEFRLRRHGQRTAETRISAALSAGSRIQLTRLGPPTSGALRVLSEGLAGPVRTKVNRILRDAVVRRFQIGLAWEKIRWKRRNTLLGAVWSNPQPESFQAAYQELLRGSLPLAQDGLRLSGRFERVRGKRMTVTLNIFNWRVVQKTTEQITTDALIVDPAGNLVHEQTTTLEAKRHRWDEIQFIRLLHREISGPEGRSREFLWTYGHKDAFEHQKLRQALRMLLQTQIIPDFALPPVSVFPLNVDLLVATRFSAEGLERVRRADPDSQWEALVRSLELSEADRYAGKTFWRDWIDHPQVRESIDRDPVHTHLESRYPLARRTDFERRQVVSAYLRSRRFLRLLENWREGDKDLLKNLKGGLDLPIFIFFHLLCPARLRTSGTLMSGDFEQAWGDPELLA